MVYKKATYEEYCKASNFAKIRYRFGLFINTIALILLLFLVFYTVTNIEEMKVNPKDYAEEKLGVICNAPIYEPIYEIPIPKNGSFRNIRNT